MRVISCILLLALPYTTFAFEIQDELLAKIAAEFGLEARTRLETWRVISSEGLDQTSEQKLEKVNRFFNQVPFVSDIDHWGMEDYWATPVELLARYAADCEDYSIAKYLTLRALGIAEDQLRLTYVKALELDQAHMVLTYYATPQSDPLVLDNLIDEIKPASQRSDLKPVYSFNAEGLWLTSLQRADERRIGDSGRLQRWVDLNQRIVDSFR